MEPTEAHLRRLHILVSEGFEALSFPLFPTHIGVKKYGCAALLEPVAEGRLWLFAPPGYLVAENISVIVERRGEKWFVWKSEQVRATPERLSTLRRFEEELRGLLECPPPV